MSIRGHNDSPAKTIAVGKSGQLTTTCKGVLSEQHQRLSAKNGHDLDLIDDLRTFFKVKCNIEKDYAQALIKLSASHQSKKYPQFMAETDSDVKSLYTAWKAYLEEMDRVAKHRLSQFEQNASTCDTLKHMKTHKAQMGKKSIDQHLKKMHEEIISSVTEVDKMKKAYFDEEHYAKKARETEEKVKKKKGGLFSKFTDLQSKKEKTSAQREAGDIQSTQARNEYIMALRAGNAHLNHYYTLDLPTLMHAMDDEVLDKCKGFILTLLQSEISSANAATEAIEKSTVWVETTSADFTKSAFLAEASSGCLRETIQFDFDACEGDSLTTVCIEHNAELALQYDVTKWMSCYQKECRNLNRLAQQLVKCQSLLAQGHKTVEVRGQGQMDLESQIDEIKQQIRKCDISKAKALARLLALKEGGMDVEDLETVEANITTEMKQVSLEVDVGQQPLSRTPSLRSTNASEGRVSSMENKSYSEDQPETDKDYTPEPNQLEQQQQLSEDNDQGPDSEPDRDTPSTYQHESYDAGQAGWSEYDPTAAWDSEPQPPAPEDLVEEVAPEEVAPEGYEGVPVGTDMVGKVCRALYSYDALNPDELSFAEVETLTIVAAVDQDWVTAQNERGEVGYVPAAYMEIIGDAPDDTQFADDAAAAGVSEVVAPEYVEAGQAAPVAQVIVTDDTDYVRALYEYTATSDEEISFNAGDMIKIIEKSEDGWWLGEKDGVVGHFASMLVEELGEDEEEEDEDEEEASESHGSAPSVGSTDFPMSPDGGPPPPSFAPPKPVSLTPQVVNIIQPTPEIESRGTFGEPISPIDDLSVDDGIGDENSDDNGQSVEVAANPEFTLDQPHKRPNQGGSVAERREVRATGKG